MLNPKGLFWEGNEENRWSYMLGVGHGDNDPTQ